MPSDTLGQLTPPFVWTNLEVTIGVIAASLPTLGPLWKAFRETISTRGRSSDPNSDDSVAAAKRRAQRTYSSDGFPRMQLGSQESVAPLQLEKLDVSHIRTKPVDTSTSSLRRYDSLV
ncbi:MAG: hypothetical protein Q9165_002725 [Trypethelium subeluteriae]